MAGPQFFTPRSVRPSRPRRRFTLDQANRSLPLVQRIVGDIVRTHGDAVKLQRELEQVSPKSREEFQKRLELAMHHLEDYVDELSEIGCELKDYQTGLIDFTGRHRGHDVCLCWKLGEERVGYWHELDSGFAGRQPVSTLEERE
ncbi:MAG: hypothetical protein JWL69_3803 [Phycisphaerales bacterium]|jgi:hypothetical protein|nr:hypothetical protein [Phycisphaerales bacterium]MDB5354544.1 hypothetical protein [Phycisphaerales bacterium]